MAALNNRFRPRFGVFRLRGFSLTSGTSPALKIALRLCLESNPPSRLRIRTVDLETRQSDHPLQGVQSLRKEHGIRFIHRRHGKRGQHKAVVLDDCYDFLALLMFVAGIADTMPPFFATVLEPSP
jgi:hypothetical protein